MKQEDIDVLVNGLKRRYPDMWDMDFTYLGSFTIGTSDKSYIPMPDVIKPNSRILYTESERDIMHYFHLKGIFVNKIMVPLNFSEQVTKLFDYWFCQKEFSREYSERTILARIKKDQTMRWIMNQSIHPLSFFGTHQKSNRDYSHLIEKRPVIIVPGTEDTEVEKAIKEFEEENSKKYCD